MHHFENISFIVGGCVRRWGVVVIDITSFFFFTRTTRVLRSVRHSSIKAPVRPVRPPALSTTALHFILSIRSFVKKSLWPCDNVSQIRRQVAGTSRPPLPTTSCTCSIGVFLIDYKYFTLRLASYSKVCFPARYAPYQA